jgi:hypothetical protein
MPILWHAIFFIDVSLSFSTACDSQLTPLSSWLLSEALGRAARLVGFSYLRGENLGLADLLDQARTGAPVGRTRASGQPRKLKSSMAFHWD